MAQLKTQLAFQLLFAAAVVLEVFSYGILATMFEFRERKNDPVDKDSEERAPVNFSEEL